MADSELKHAVEIVDHAVLQHDCINRVVNAGAIHPDRLNEEGLYGLDKEELRKAVQVLESYKEGNGYISNKIKKIQESFPYLRS